MLIETKCKRCGKKIFAMERPIMSSQDTMEKWRGICSNCLSDQEKFQMMTDMNRDVSAKLK